MSKKTLDDDLMEMAKIEKIIEVYDNGHKNEFTPKDFIVVKKDKKPSEPCPLCNGEKLDELNEIEDKDKRYHEIQDFINGLLYDQEKKWQKRSGN